MSMCLVTFFTALQIRDSESSAHLIRLNHRFLVQVATPVSDKHHKCINYAVHSKTFQGPFLLNTSYNHLNQFPGVKGQIIRAKGPPRKGSKLQEGHRKGLSQHKLLKPAVRLLCLQDF